MLNGCMHAHTYASAHVRLKRGHGTGARHNSWPWQSCSTCVVYSSCTGPPWLAPRLTLTLLGIAVLQASAPIALGAPLVGVLKHAPTKLSKPVNIQTSSPIPATIEQQGVKAPKGTSLGMTSTQLRLRRTQCVRVEHKVRAWCARSVAARPGTRSRTTVRGAWGVPTWPANQVLVVEGVHHSVAHGLVAQKDEAPRASQRTVGAGQTFLLRHRQCCACCVCVCMCVHVVYVHVVYVHVVYVRA